MQPNVVAPYLAGGGTGNDNFPQPDYPTSISMGARTQNAIEIMKEEDFQAQGPGMEAAYTAYQTALKQIFENILKT